MAAPTLDGHASIAGHVAGTGPYNVTLTTTKTNDIIVVMIYNENANNSSIRTVTAVSGAGLTWARRGGQSYVTNPAVSGHTNGVNLEYWWALAASALSAQAITVTLSGTTDDYAMVAFGVNGCRVASPWDSNASLPKLGNTDESRPEQVTGANTTEGNDLLLCFEGATTGPGVPPNPVGWTLIDSAGTNAATLDANGGAWLIAVTVPQTGQSASLDNGSGVGGAIMIVDALTADAVPASKGGHMPLLGAGR